MGDSKIKNNYANSIERSIDLLSPSDFFRALMARFFWVFTVS